MALWPFRRRSGRKRSRSGALSDVEGAPPTRSQTEGVVTRAGSKKKQRTEPAKLHRRARTYSFSPGRDDSIRVDRHHPGSPTAERTGRAGNRHDQDDDPLGTWNRTPTLHHRRSTQNASRRKRSSRRREDHQREAEIKALSNFEPVRPATDQWYAGRPMKKDSKRVKSGGHGRPWENSRASEVSLPAAGSVHSSLSSDSEYGSYKVSALDVLAPRPTLRYMHPVRHTPSHISGTNRSGSHGKRLANRQPIPEETMRANKRIDDLADDLDSSGLRELMERDKRRREKKRQNEQERMEQRLARRAEKQKAEELEAKKSGTPPPENLERGVLGRELVGLGIEPKSAVVTSSKHRYSGDSVSMQDADADTEDESPKKPFETFHRTDTAPSEEPTVAEEETSRRGSTVPRKSDEQASMSTGTKFSGLLRSVKSRSKSTLGSERDKVVSPPPGTIDEEDVTRKDFEGSTKGGRFSISSFLRWGGKNRGLQDSGPSSFSNTSREEMQAAATAQAQAQALAKLQGEDTSISESYSGNYLARKISAPKRTRSRFREDLPEFPVSPPASRVQSPEAELPIPKLSEHKIGEREPLRISAVRYDTPTSARPTPTSMERVYASPSPEPHMSMSLASIDSEGSWLSGNVGARKLAMRESLRRANRRDRAGSSSGSPTNSTQEDLAITEDEYLSKLTPRRNSSHNALGRRSGEGRPSSDEEDLVDDVDLKWGAVGSHPQVVHSHTHDRLTMKSHEGLLDIESENEDSDNSPVSPTDQEIGDVRRARSVNLGKGHVRNFSAGSAKLLEISPRASVDDKRRVSSRRGSAFAVLM